MRAYADIIQRYVDEGLLRVTKELYYPIRLKPSGVNNLLRLRSEGVNHIELRMFDLNPLVPAGVDERDIRFAQLFLVWLACIPKLKLSVKDQVRAVQNFKNAAHYDLKTVRIVPPEGYAVSVADAALHILEKIREFYHDFPQDVLDIIDFEKTKFTDAENRYAWIIRRTFDHGFIEKGLKLAKQRQDACE